MPPMRPPVLSAFMAASVDAAISRNRSRPAAPRRGRIEYAVDLLRFGCEALENAIVRAGVPPDPRVESRDSSERPGRPQSQEYRELQ